LSLQSAGETSTESLELLLVDLFSAYQEYRPWKI